MKFKLIMTICLMSSQCAFSSQIDPDSLRYQEIEIDNRPHVVIRLLTTITGSNMQCQQIFPDSTTQSGASSLILHYQEDEALFEVPIVQEWIIPQLDTQRSIFTLLNNPTIPGKKNLSIFIPIRPLS